MTLHYTNFFIIFVFFFLRQNGFPNNLETYGMISGLWTSTFALGAAIGPSVAGILYDAWGFSHASLFVIMLGIVVVSRRLRIIIRQS